MENNNDEYREHSEYHNCNIVKGDVYGGVFALPGSHVTINNNGNEPTKTNATEKPEEREKRKMVVMNSIVARFNFGDYLGKINGRQVTNDQVKGLFKQCFGIGSNPQSDWKEAIEKVWVLLIDKRDKCSKVEGEDFFRHTVLNIVGYFRQRGVLQGDPKELMYAIFKDAEDNQEKNIVRGEYHPEKVRKERYPLPEEFVKVMDYYISELKGR